MKTRCLSRRLAWLFPFLLLHTILYIPGVVAQQSPEIPLSDTKEPFIRRFSVGGNLGFQVGNVTGINVAPQITFRVVDHLHVGTRFIYQYFSYKDYYFDLAAREYLSYKSNVFGGGLFSRYYLSGFFNNILGNLFAHAEYEYLFYRRPYTLSGDADATIEDFYGNRYKKSDQSVEVNSFFVGGGFRQPVGNRVSFDLLVLFNLNDTFNSPYTNPIFRIGVGVGL